MTVWESGRESQLLDDIIAGRKTVEGRLKRGKFAQYRAGDVIKLRRDIRGDDGVLCDGEPDQARVKIIAIREYLDFLSLCQAEGYKRVIPHAMSAEEAADEYNKYYTTEDQAGCGVLAIEVVPLLNIDGWNMLYRKGVEYKQLSDADVTQLVRYVPESTPRTALDIGCGAGELARQLQKCGFQVTGVDPSEEAIVRARQADNMSEYVVGDISSVEKTFGVVTCKLVYAFIEDKTEFLADVKQRLDPRGFFVVLAPTHDHPINHKKGIHVDRETMYRELRTQFHIIHKQQTKLGVLVICRHKCVSLDA